MQHLHQPLSDLLRLTVKEKDIYVSLLMEQLEEQRKAIEEATASSGNKKHRKGY